MSSLKLKNNDKEMEVDKENNADADAPKQMGEINMCFGSGDISSNKSNQVSNTNVNDISASSVNASDASNEFVIIPNLPDSNSNTKDATSRVSVESRPTNDLIPLVPLKKKSIDMESCLIEKEKETNQRWYTILLQVLFPFFVAGFGMVAAGVVLDKVQHWEIFKNVKAIYTLVPALLGLKGNLEMTLASRFSTQANLGKFNDKTSTINAVLGNFALTQCQAIVVGFLASLGAVLLECVTSGEVDIQDSLVLISGSISTASFASLILAGLMMFVIIISTELNINPDNIATPIAASLGDLVTLTILSFLCTFLYYIKAFIWVQVLIVVLFTALVPVFVYFSYRNDFVKDALYNGWVPIILAMAISSTGGSIMGFAVSVYADIAVFQPVVNGVGGNLVAIFASRLSTVLHQTSTMGSKASWAPSKWYHYPYDTFFSKKNPESKAAIVLVFLAIPGHLVFYYSISKIKMINQDDSYNPATTTLAFVSFYLSISTLQVIMLFLICYWLVHISWQRNKNPDNISIPYLTAIGDLLGTALLAICFHVLYLSGEIGLRKPA